MVRNRVNMRDFLWKVRRARAQPDDSFALLGVSVQMHCFLLEYLPFAWFSHRSCSSEQRTIEYYTELIWSMHTRIRPPTQRNESHPTIFPIENQSIKNIMKAVSLYLASFVALAAFPTIQGQTLTMASTMLHRQCETTCSRDVSSQDFDECVNLCVACGAD